MQWLKELFGFGDNEDLDPDKQRELKRLQRNQLIRQMAQIFDPTTNPEAQQDYAGQLHRQQLAEAKMAAEEKRAQEDQLIQQAEHERNKVVWEQANADRLRAEEERKTLDQSLVEQAIAQELQHPGIERQRLKNQGELEIPDIMSQYRSGPDGMPMLDDSMPMGSRPISTEGMRGIDPAFLADLLEEEQARDAKVFTRGQNRGADKDKLSDKYAHDQMALAAKIAAFDDESLSPEERMLRAGGTIQQGRDFGDDQVVEAWLGTQKGYEGMPRDLAETKFKSDIIQGRQLGVAQGKLDIKNLDATEKQKEELSAIHSFMMDSTGSEEQANSAVLARMTSLNIQPSLQYGLTGEFNRPRVVGGGGSGKIGGLSAKDIQKMSDDLIATEDDPWVKITYMGPKAGANMDLMTQEYAKKAGFLVEVPTEHGFYLDWVNKEMSPAAFASDLRQRLPDILRQAVGEKAPDAAIAPGANGNQSNKPAAPIVLSTKEVRDKQQGIRSWIKTLPDMTDEEVLEKAKSEGIDEATLKLVRQVLGEK